MQQYRYKHGRQAAERSKGWIPSCIERLQGVSQRWWWWHWLLMHELGFTQKIMLGCPFWAQMCETAKNARGIVNPPVFPESRCMRRVSKRLHQVPGRERLVHHWRIFWICCIHNNFLNLCHSCSPFMIFFVSGSCAFYLNYLESKLFIIGKWKTGIFCQRNKYNKHKMIFFNSD